MGNDDPMKIIVALVLLIGGGLVGLFLFTGCEPKGTPEVESGLTENWYRGTTINTSVGMYVLTGTNRDIQAMSLDFYPKGAGADHSSMTVFFHRNFMIGNQLYYLEYVEFDYIIVELVEEAS